MTSVPHYHDKTRKNNGSAARECDTTISVYMQYCLYKTGFRILVRCTKGNKNTNCLNQ